MRVLVYGVSGGQVGGIETFVLNMNRFMDDNIRLNYAIQGEGHATEGMIRDIGGEIYRIASRNNLPKHIRDWARLLRDRKKDTDAVYFNLFSLALFVPIMLSRLYGYRVYVHAHNNMLHDCGAPQRILHQLGYWLLKPAKIIRLTNSELSARFFFGDKPAEMVYNAIDTERFRFQPEVRAKLRSELGAGEKHVYGFAGRIAYQKNPLFLMEIFAEIAKRDSNAFFLVCGNGNLMEETQKRASELGVDVRFCGAVSNVQDYYQAMDCFVLPSRFEGLGIVLIEAQCAGLPSLTSADVVPKAAQATDVLEYLPLEGGASMWAEAAVRQVKRENDRATYEGVVAASPFNIRTEALRLEGILSSVEEKRE